jgi:predicted RNase H-like HicB family nuclease
MGHFGVGHSRQYSQAIGIEEMSQAMRYAIVIEESEKNLSAYVPDLPGCVATGASVAEVENAIREAIELHLAGLREDGLPVPVASSRVDYVEVAA